MKSRFIKIILLLATAIFLFAHYSSAEEDVGVVKKGWRNFLDSLKKPADIAPVPSKARERDPFRFPRTEMGPEESAPKASPLSSQPVSEIIDRTKEMLEAMPEIADAIPELKVTRDADGNVTNILYNTGAGYIDIRKLKKDAIVKLYSLANNERARIQTERIQRQIQESRPPRTIPRPPAVVRPPSVPRIPTVPVLPNIPRIPTPPPSVPKAPPTPPPPPPRR